MQLLLQNAGWWQWSVSLVAQIQGAVWDSINSMITGFFARLPFILAGLIVLLIFWLLSKLVRKIFLATTQRTKLDGRLRTLISRILVVFVISLGVMIALTVIIPSFSFASLIAGLGFSSFVVGFATRDILNNFLSGILILWQQPFHIGDYLFVGSNQGKVEYIGVRATSLRKDDGEIVLIPNGDMYSSALTIRGAGANRRMNLKFCVGYHEPLQKTKRLTREALDRTEGIVQDPKPTVVVTDMLGEGVSITVNFWLNTNDSKPLEVFDRAAMAIIETLNRAEIVVYPPGAMVVKQDDEAVPVQEPEDTKKKKDEF
jgi:small conductance mechanosensitive channel